MFIVEARHGAWVSPFSENVKMKVVATGIKSCKVVIESSSRSILNLLNFGTNKGNVSDLSGCISNEVYKLQDVVYDGGKDHSAIRVVQPQIWLE